MTTVTPIAGATFGAEIRGLALRADMDPEAMRLVTGALYDHRVVVVRDQSFDEAGYVAFGRRWGDPIPHVLDHMRMPGFPELMTIGNTEERDRKEEIRNGAVLWHTDQSYEAVPASATMLYSILAPEVGGETQFCDMVAAYENLDEATRRRVDGLEIAHKYGRGRRRSEERVVNPLTTDDQDRRVPPVYHPMVLPHPITGRRALYALGHGAYAIRGMPDDEAADLIDALKDHALDERHIYRHPYTAGDVVIWDTLATMHSASPIEPATSRRTSRLLWRISVRGKPEIYRETA